MSEPQHERHPEGERADQPTGTAPDGTAPDASATDTTVNDSTEDTRVIETKQPMTEPATSEYPATSAFAARPERGEHVPGQQGEVPAPARPSGPHLPPIVLGLACLVIAGLALAQELGHLQVDWGDVGPLGIVAAGAVLVVLGLVGLLTSRRRES